ncbi:hypothetical protein COU79_04925, partial [Candidatus Peregrinibacteria bacterium CG10_big_fil_rev_8_21_14_0_10_54_7]
MNAPSAPIQAKLTCPHCSEKQTAAMPGDACVPFFVCKVCKKMVKAKEGDCCVFCSFGDRKCSIASS